MQWIAVNNQQIGDFTLFYCPQTVTRGNICKDGQSAEKNKNQD
jgi:hypothetical protein